MRLSHVTRALLLATCIGGSAFAQTAPAPAPATAPAPAPKDPVVARVNGREIHLSDVNAVADGLPEQLRGMPAEALYPMLLEQVVDRQAMADLARKQGLASDPAVQRVIARATDQALTTALLQRDVGPSLSEDAIKAIYERDYANKPGEQEVHARHILLATEDAAKKVIADLKGGADFATVAKAQSTEPGAAQSGGDLGFFKKADMVPEFADAAFAMKPGEISSTPVHTQFGWHVIQLVEVRQAPPQTLEQMHDQIRQKLIQDGVQKVQAEALAGVTVERFNADGTPQRGADGTPQHDASGTPPAPKP